MRRHFYFGTQRIDFTLTYSKRKSLGVKVYPDVSVMVIAPLEAEETIILKKLRSKAPWILKQIEDFNSFRPATPPRRFVNGETHLYLGRQYRLKIVPDEMDAVKVYRGRLMMHATNTAIPTLRDQLQKWYKKKARIVFEELLEEVLPKFKRYKIPAPILAIRSMSKRWGSCASGGKIILNSELIKASKVSIEYVIVHELYHLVHRNHGKAFFNLLNRVLPDWKKLKDRLEYGLV